MASTATTQAETIGPDWTVTAVDRIESAVSVVRDNATTRLVVAARAAVFGLIALAMGLAILLLLTVAMLRIVEVYLANWHFAGLNDHPGRSVWVAEALVGGIFSLPGLFLLRKASARHKED